VEVIRPTLHETASLFQPALLTNLVKTKDASLRGPNIIKGMMMQKKLPMWMIKTKDSIIGRDRARNVLKKTARRMIHRKRSVVCHR
jgi:hypothetical protein